MKHLSEADIVASVAGESSDHILECPACAAEVERMRVALGLFRQSGIRYAEYHPGHSPVRRRLGFRAAIAAVAMIAIIAGFIGFSQWRSPSAPRQVFVQIPYVIPAAPYERTSVVQMYVPVAALIAAGFSVRSSAEAALPMDVLVGQDGRALALRPSVESEIRRNE